MSGLVGIWIGWIAAALADDPSYRMGAHDIVDVAVYGEPNLSNTVTLGEDGAAVLMHVGRVDLAGATPIEAADRIRRAYMGGWLVDPIVTVAVKEYRSQKVEVYGAVKKPGPYYLQGPTTLREMLGEAGWLDTTKASRRVELRRASGEVVVGSIDDLMGGASSLQTTLEAGDVINVAQDVFVYVTGAVKRPGEIGFIEGMTATVAIHEAGGWADTAALGRATLLRGTERIKFSIRRIQRGKESDVVLLEGDQIVVRESVF